MRFKSPCKIRVSGFIKYDETYLSYRKTSGGRCIFHLTRNGIKPETFKEILVEWSELLNKNNVSFSCNSYEDVIPDKNDFVFLDPPYANTKGMYNGTIDLDMFWNKLRSFECGYTLTFDGKRTDADNTYDVPIDIYNKHIYLDGKISGFKKLHKDVSYVSESLYIKSK